VEKLIYTLNAIDENSKILKKKLIQITLLDMDHRVIIWVRKEIFNYFIHGLEDFSSLEL
jgi:hypothetical protein